MGERAQAVVPTTISDVPTPCLGTPAVGPASPPIVGPLARAPARCLLGI